MGKDFGHQSCEVTTVDDERRLAHRFAEDVLDTTITWTLHPDDRGTPILQPPQAYMPFGSSRGGPTKRSQAHVPLSASQPCGPWRSRACRQASQGTFRELNTVSRVSATANRASGAV